MKEIKVGEYVRLDNGHIGKIQKIGTYKVDNENIVMLYCSFSIGSFPILQDEMIKHSKKIIDLIEEGDYVNGEYVYGIDDFGKRKLIDAERDLFDNKDIKSIVTKEQFKNMEYKAGK